MRADDDPKNENAELVEGHTAEEVESKEAEESSTDENMSHHRLTNPQIDENNYSSSGNEKIDTQTIESKRSLVANNLGRGDESSRTEESTMPHSSFDEPDDEDDGAQGNRLTADSLF